MILHLLRFTVYELAEFPGFVSGGAPDTNGFMLDDEAGRLREHVTQVLEADGDPPPYEIDVDWGSPYLQIVEVAIDRKADLIVMGTHGRTGIKHAMLGSIAEKTVRLGPCPVLTVHADAERRLVTEKLRCVSCHQLRGVGARAGHLRAWDGEIVGGFGLPLEEYPPAVWRRYCFEQLAVAEEIGASPVPLGDDARLLFELVERERRR